MPLSPTMRRDVMSAYGASAARITSWVIVSAMVYRKLGADAFAMLTLVRATVGLLAYAALGIAPAMISRLANASVASIIRAPIDDEGPLPVLDYQSSAPQMRDPQTIFFNGLMVVLVSGAVGIVLAG